MIARLRPAGEVGGDLQRMVQWEGEMSGVTTFLVTTIR